MSLGETRYQLRLALSRHVVGQDYRADLDPLVDELLNYGIDRPVLINIAIASPDLPRSTTDLVHTLVRELDLRPHSMVEPEVATHIIEADYASHIVCSSTPRETRDLVSDWIGDIHERHQSELVFYTKSRYSWLADVSDRFYAAIWESKRFRFTLRKLELAADIAADAKRFAADFLQSLPEEVRDPAAAFSDPRSSP